MSDSPPGSAAWHQKRIEAQGNDLQQPTQRVVPEDSTEPPAWFKELWHGQISLGGRFKSRS